jgi:hypothetical protein
MILNSFSVVATKECKEELAVLCFSIRRLYDLPIYVLCDSETKKYIEGFSFNNIIYNLSADPEGLAVATEKVKGVNIDNNFHSAAKIYLKMDCLEQAVIETGNTLFLDADIILAKPVHSDLSTHFDVMLSPHYHPTNTLEQNKRYGAFNAGYLWANSQYVAPIWRDLYMSRSSFYEQQGMIWFFEYMDVGILDKSHNFGFCRFAKDYINDQIFLKGSGYQDAKSYHLHTVPKTYIKADSGLKAGYETLYRTIFPSLPKDIKQFIHEVRDETKV